ncbi:MAG: bifunctional tetrahydrofolate synthase/dihydrofolate synthase [Pseudomonadota bacterium]|nr:bifunctional tetrahydrofolate synthase/dihydrofolate synthase [Pseudomonadota bacterium]
MAGPPFSTLAQWLAWQETLHPQAIDLRLERLQALLGRLEEWRRGPPFAVVTVGGTNGKGSSVAFLDAMLRAGGYRVGSYTSPHLHRYTERIRIGGQDIADDELCRIFARLDSVRGDIPLTYFEWGTLAAFEHFRQAQVQVAVLEVGLGGRLDAVNVLDADAALVTAVDIDHVEWLGPDRESIGYEKAGIFRPGRPAVCADPQPPASLLAHARHIGARLYRAGVDYQYERDGGGWSWRSDTVQLSGLPLPRLAGEHQLANAAGALMALQALSERLPLTPDALRQGIARAWVGGRFQVLPGAVEWILDVAHNPHGAAALARSLEARPCAGRTLAVLGMLSGKDAAGVAQAMAAAVDRWYPAALGGARGRGAAELLAALRTGGIIAPAMTFADVATACRTAAADARAGDRVVVFGSFYTVAEALAAGLPVQDRPTDETASRRMGFG